jgi:outer membrane protein OmpA-like peptidoglycan-associated protein
MKKIILLSLALLLAFAAAGAKKNIAVRNLKVTKNGETVDITFSADIPRRTARSSKTLVFVPVLKGGNYSWSLPAIVVEGRRARIANRRHDWASEASALQPAFDDVAVTTTNKSTVDYSTTVDWQPWMDGGDLTAEILTMGCCSHDISDDTILARNLDLPAPVTVKLEPVVEPEPLPTTGDRLAEEHSFIAPYSDFEHLSPGKLFDDDRENSLIVYFHQSKYSIDPLFRENARNIENLVASIRELQNSSDSRVRTVVVAGFASPEGSFVQNDRLAFDRAASVKNYILKKTGLADETIMLYNGSEDWRGLKILVEQSDMPSKEAVLRIIDTVPVWDSVTKQGREKSLMDLDGGIPYRYMYRYFFPLLRNAAYIKIYYDNK